MRTITPFWKYTTQQYANEIESNRHQVFTFRLRARVVYRSHLSFPFRLSAWYRLLTEQPEGGIGHCPSGCTWAVPWDPVILLRRS